MIRAAGGPRPPLATARERVAKRMQGEVSRNKSNAVERDALT